MCLLAASASVVVISHPASLAGLLIIVALLVRALLGAHSLSWFLYLLALVFLGGVIVVLLFMVSVCANEKFYASKGLKSAGFALVPLVGGLVYNPVLNFSAGFRGFQFSGALYEAERALPFIFFILILILCLVRVVGVRRLESGPLVKRL